MNNNKKELFCEIERKALQKTNKYDYIIFSSKTVGANIFGSRASKIRNGLIIVQSDGGWREWQINDYRLRDYPEPFILCVKNSNNAAVCAGDREDERSYFFFKNMEEQSPQPVSVIGVIETEKYVLAFDFDWERKKSYYLTMPQEGNEDSEIFVIAKSLWEMRRSENGASDKKSD